MTEITVSFPGGKRVDAHTASWHIQTDQSPEKGGTGTAPEPFTLFLASLATCAGIYALSFCQARNIPTEGLGLTMSSAKDAAGKRLEQVTLKITLPEGFPEKYRPVLVRSVSQCAVKKVLDAPPVFAVELENVVVDNG